jgi:hypothetical protein
MLNIETACFLTNGNVHVFTPVTLAFGAEAYTASCVNLARCRLDSQVIMNMGNTHSYTNQSETAQLQENVKDHSTTGHMDHSAKEVTEVHLHLYTFNGDMGFNLGCSRYWP